MNVRFLIALVLGTASLYACATKIVPGVAPSDVPVDAGVPDDTSVLDERDADVADVRAPDASGSCPSSGAPTSSPPIDDNDVDETSGIVSSAFNPGVFWIHNDSGDPARAFAVDANGKVLASLAFDVTKPIDIEDIAIEVESPARSYLYLGDIGDNAEARTELTIHRVVEPTVGGDGGAKLTATSEKMLVAYSDGPHNAETLLFDPTTKDLLIATKSTLGPSDIHRVGPFSAGAKVTTEKIASVGVALATGGDISRDGRFIAIRNYGTFAYVWLRNPGESVADALSREPCHLPVASEKQGEAFGFLSENQGYVTISEGASPRLHTSRFP